MIQQFQARKNGQLLSSQLTLNKIFVVVLLLFVIVIIGIICDSFPNKVYQFW